MSSFPKTAIDGKDGFIMRSKEFIGSHQIVKDTPSGGKITVAFGDIVTLSEQRFQAIAIQIKDPLDGLVCEFALQPETFGVLIDSIKELYDECI